MQFLKKKNIRNPPTKILDSTLLPSVMLLDEFIRAVGDDGEA